MEENFISWLASTKKHQCTRELLASDPEREPGSRNAHSDLIVPSQEISGAPGTDGLELTMCRRLSCVRNRTE